MSGTCQEYGCHPRAKEPAVAPLRKECTFSPGDTNEDTAITLRIPTKPFLFALREPEKSNYNECAFKPGALITPKGV